MKIRVVPIEKLSTLQELVLQQIEALEGQVRVLEVGINIESGTVVLGLDLEGRLVVLVMGVTKEEELLIRLIGAYAWVSRNLSLLAHFYSKQGLDGTKVPRMIAIAPAFSQAVVEGLPCLAFTAELYVYRGLEVNGEQTVLLVSLADQVLKPSAVEATLTGSSQTPMKASHLTEAEIRFFKESHPSGPAA